MASQSSSSSGGISATGLLGVLFVGLKLTGYINWPWVWVLAPFWVPLAILLAIIAVVAVCWALIQVIEAVSKN